MATLKPIVAVLVSVLALAPNALAANSQGEPGPLLERTSHLQVEGVTLRTALEELSRTAGIALAYSPSLLPAEPRVSCPCSEVSVAGALARILVGSGFDFREDEGQVILIPARAGGSDRPNRNLRVAMGGALGIVRPALDEEPSLRPVVAPVLTPPVRAATITGTVTSEGGEPVLGAQVTLSRTGLSTTTNASGNYRIVVPTERVIAGPDTLRVERIGYAPTDVAFELRDGDIQLDVVMPFRAVALDQIVVTGTAGNQERRAQAAVVGTIAAADIVREAPINNVSQLLQARLPGVTITESSGTTGASSRISIRGAASISLSNQPLIFIDGVRVEGGSRALVNVSGSNSAIGQAPSALNDLNPDDIESIEVVKGPAAATLYGADASAGVIQIITKKGRVGSRAFAQEISLEYDEIDPNFTVPTNYARCIEVLVTPDSPNPLCRNQEVGTLITDNPAERINAFRNGWLGSVKYNARGGGENYGYFASFGLANEQGTTPNNLMKQRTGRVNFTFAPTSALTFDATFAISRTDYDLPRSDQDAYGYYVQSILGSPLTVRDDPDGSLAGGMLFGQSSFESLSSITSRASALRTTPSLQVRFAPLPWFTHRVTVGADLTNGRGFQLFPKNDEGWYPTRLSLGNGDVQTIERDERTYTIDYLGNVNARFGAEEQFSSNLSFGSQFIHRVNNLLSGAGGGLVTNSAILVDNTATSTVGQGFGESKSLGLFLQEQVGFEDRLFLQLGFRADRNSAFGSDVGTFFLPKFGASWVVSEEPFWEGLSATVPTARLRAAYGTTGRSPESGASLRTYQTERYVTDNGLIELGVVPGNPGNADLKPERGKELEFGVDIGLLNDRVGAELTYFNKKSTDLLVSVPISPSSGFGQRPLGNVGEVVNRGFEFLVRATPVSRRDVALDLTLNGSTLHNEITSLGSISDFIDNFRAFQPGYQIAAWWAHRIRNVDTQQGVATVSAEPEFSGNQLPTFEANFTTSLTLFQNVRLHAVFDRKSGHYVYNLNQEFRDRSSRSSPDVNLSEGEGGYSDFERLRRLGPYVNEETGLPVGVADVKEPYLQKGDHVRFRELTATFTLPPSLVQRFRATGASITVGGRNLGLWGSDYEGHDPDVIGVGVQNGGLNQLFNTDVFTTPPSRRWIVRANLQF